VKNTVSFLGLNIRRSRIALAVGLGVPVWFSLLAASLVAKRVQEVLFSPEIKKPDAPAMPQDPVNPDAPLEPHPEEPPMEKENFL
jgi:hypothetical protein